MVSTFQLTRSTKLRLTHLMNTDKREDRKLSEAGPSLTFDALLTLSPYQIYLCPSVFICG